MGSLERRHILRIKIKKIIFIIQRKKLFLSSDLCNFHDFLCCQEKDAILLPLREFLNFFFRKIYPLISYKCIWLLVKNTRSKVMDESRIPSQVRYLDLLLRKSPLKCKEIRYDFVSL